jgi:pimeloyl-ACP methyl ester carboxylesterase
MSRRPFACFVALAIAAGVLVGVVPAAAGTPDTTTTTSATTSETSTATGLSAWKPCGKRVQCAILRVPVDYTQPDGQQVGIAVSRVRATGDATPLGSLVVNFGGPVDAGSTTLPSFVGQIPAAIRKRYDLVSFDPRGVGNSRPVHCIDSATADRLNAIDPTPNSTAELPAYYDGTHEQVDLIAQCIAKNGQWLADVGSRNVARDLDRLRIALGDDTLTYLGFSYGTVIGAVYAQMFPDRVGRLVLDSPVDLSSSALDEIRANAAGFEGALDAFLDDCAKRPKCAFYNGGHPATALSALQARFEQGLRLKTANPINGASSDRKAGVAAFYTALISALYDKKYGWPNLAQGLGDAQKGDGSILQYLADSYNGRRDNGTYDNIDEVIGVILCDDRRDAVPSLADFTAEYERDVATYPFLGSYVGSTPLGCDPRLPAAATGEELGDVRVHGTPPILVVGTTNDPATPYAGAVDLAGRIAGSRLLTFDSTEHTAYTKSRCIDDAVDAYLLDGTLPAEGKRCSA